MLAYHCCSVGVCVYLDLCYYLKIRPHPSGQTSYVCPTRMLLYEESFCNKCSFTIKALTFTMTMYTQINKKLEKKNVFFKVEFQRAFFICNHHNLVCRRMVYYKRLYIHFPINILYVQIKGCGEKRVSHVCMSWNTSIPLI